MKYCVMLFFSIFIFPLTQATFLTPQAKTLLHWKSTLENQSTLGSWDLRSNPCNWTDLLDLSSNSLTGQIPPAFANLVMLQNLNLSHNNLTGQIPISLVDMQSLSVIDLSYNQLEGPLPDNHFFREAPTKWFIHNKNLCGTVQVHRDISSKNILLDSEFKARVSDFGTAKFLKPDSSNWSMLAGTFELAYTSRVTEKCDVYSYGVVVTELLMGKHPGDVNQMINIQSQNIWDSAWLLDIVDQRLPIPTDQEMKEVERITKIAFKCLDSNPISRPSMQQVVKCFELQSKETRAFSFSSLPHFFH
ncbi:hypothetical protein LUZ60_013282 [Juncus effusus]|nr:hypothetical protein LUZ60_013282 [Juncus effusus]